MRIDERTLGNTTVVAVHGRMTRTDGYGMVKERIGTLLEDGQCQFVLDLSDVDFMDSSCVGELVGAFITTRNQEGALKFAGISDRIAQLLAVAKLDSVFELFATDTAAAESFSRS